MSYEQVQEVRLAGAMIRMHATHELCTVASRCEWHGCHDCATETDTGKLLWCPRPTARKLKRCVHAWMICLL